MLAQVQQHASTVNASTVYRTLEVLEELGLVRHAHLSDRAPTYHSTRGHEHFHLVCRGCHRVVSVDAEDAAPFVESLATRHAFSPDLGHLTVFGRCHDCEGTTMSPLLDLDGAVAGDGIDAPVAAHYGSLYGEQRALAAGEGFVDLSHRDVVRITGPDRLTWLHSLTTQYFEGLEPGDLDPGAGAQPAGPRRARVRRRRRRRVLHGPHRARNGRGAGRVPRPDAVPDAGRGRDVTSEIAVAWRPAGKYDLVPRDQLMTYADAAGPAAGLWAFEALRIERGEPRFGIDTDHRTIPNEVGWIGPAVHLDKGCYRGQETVARVHNLGRPPRRLTLLHLDGSENRLPAVGADVTDEAGKVVGRVGSSARHHELGSDRARPAQAQPAHRHPAPGRRLVRRPGDPRRPRGRPPLPPLTRTLPGAHRAGVGPATRPVETRRAG